MRGGRNEHLVVTEREGPLIGRERELAELGQLLREARVVTIIGAGGCGKTRLARELVKQAATVRLPCVAFVELADLDQDGVLPEACRRALGLRERPGTAAVELILERLSEAETLLVLDDCEHVAEDAARLAEELIAGTPGRILVTSRVPLGIDAERRFVLSPLSPPQDDGLLDVLRSDAARMFLEVASVARPGLELDRSTARAVAWISRRLDGLPLALALAGARAGEMTVSEIAHSLSEHGPLTDQPGGDAQRRHASLRASLEWSSELLEPHDRCLFRRLAAFTGGWDAAAARAVCAPGAEETDVDEQLARLEAAGLIVAQAQGAMPRWTFLSTIGEYAREQLSAAGEETTARRRHYDWARDLAERADQLQLTPEGRDAIDRDRANLASALDHAVAHDPDAALAIVAGLARHWILAERLEEGRAACAAVMPIADRVADTRARATLHCAAALIAVLGENYSEALTQLGLGLPLSARGEEGTEGRCLQMASMVQILSGSDLIAGVASAHRAALLTRVAGDQLGLAMALANIAQAEGLCERFDGVRAAYEEFLQTDASEHPRLRTWAEVSIAWAELITGSPARALEHAELALALEANSTSMTHFVAMCHRLQALALLGRAEEALAQGAQAMERARAARVGMAVPAISLALAVAHAAAGDLDSAEVLATDLLEMPQLHTRALMSELLVRIALERGEHLQAATRLVAVEALAERTGSTRLTALCKYLGGRVAAQADDATRARTLLQAALALQADAGHQRAAAETLEELALVTPLGNEPRRRPRLAAAAVHARNEIGCPPPAATLERVEAARGRFTARYGERTWDDAWREGEAMTIAEAAAYARRARGSRNRSRSGWDALTPTEAEVAWLAATGLSNPEIGARLFMSRAHRKGASIGGLREARDRQPHAARSRRGA